MLPAWRTLLLRAVTVAEACNGMRMVFTLLLVCYTFTFVTPLLQDIWLWGESPGIFNAASATGRVTRPCALTSA